MSDRYLSVTHTIHDVDTRTGRHGALHTCVNTRFDTLSICCRSAHAEPPAMSRTPLRASRGSGQHGLKFHDALATVMVTQQMLILPTQI